MKTLLIGDVHGQVPAYFKVLAEYKPLRSIQLGDFGFRAHHEWHRRFLNGYQHKVLFGNHDDTSCLNMLHAMPDFGSIYIEAGGLFYVRGAHSIDQHVRITGRDWWEDEELSIVRLNQAIDAYEAARPSIVISHDCPQSIRSKLFGIDQSSRTSQALEAMLDLHQPALWVFGHHHQSIDQSINNTRFRCLAELESMWIDL